MTGQNRRILFVASVFFCDALILVLAACNQWALRDAARLPAEYQTGQTSLEFRPEDPRERRELVSIHGRATSSPMNLRSILTHYRAGDTIHVVDRYRGSTIARRIVLEPKMSSFDLATSILVGMVYFIFSLYVVLRHSSVNYAMVLHVLAMCTAVMILLDWGSAVPLPAALTFALRLAFDIAIWLLPSLFFHFSFSFPHDKHIAKRMYLAPWYAVSIAGIIASLWWLVAMFFRGVPIEQTYYPALHSTINDLFLMVGLLGTIANLEHSALIMRDADARKNVYWVLLGVIVGPLVYVFLMLVPRTLLSAELVTNSQLQYTLLIAPLMFWKVIRRAPSHLHRGPSLSQTASQDAASEEAASEEAASEEAASEGAASEEAASEEAASAVAASEKAASEKAASEEAASAVAASEEAASEKAE